jgi:hypothetical protein
MMVFIAPAIATGTRITFAFIQTERSHPQFLPARLVTVARWLNKQSSYFSGDGHYSLRGDTLRIRVAVRGGNIDYWGKVREDTLELSSHSHITGYRDRARYRFIRVHFRDHTPNQALQPTADRRE